MARPKNGARTRRVTTTLAEAEAVRLEALAKSQKVSTAWLIRRLIESYLEESDQRQQPELPLRRKRT